MPYIKEKDFLFQTIKEACDIYLTNGFSNIQHKDAYDLVNGVISNIYNLNDYSRIVDCLKNISYALFYARHYDIAHEIFSLLLHFLRLFNMEEQAYNSFLPSRSDILILKTIIDLDRKDVIHATINFNQIESTVNSVTMEEKPLIPFIRAILLANDIFKFM